VQLDLSNYNVVVVNTSNDPQAGLLLAASVYSLDNKLLLHREEKREAVADALTDGFRLELAPLLSSEGIVLVNLELRNSSGEIVSRNFYWLGENNASYRRLNHLPPASVSATAKSTRDGAIIHVHIELRNAGTSVSLADKLTLLNAADGSRILPAYYTDNYVSLLPGESRPIEIDYPAKSANGPVQLSLRGWNLTRQVVPVP
jgi:hypothetical protein